MEKIESSTEGLMPDPKLPFIDIFSSYPTPKGHSWTITSKLGHILRTAEARFGERDKSYTILGVEFTNGNCPKIWYPGDCKHIAIQITLNCINDINRAVYQVSHEVIHCLSPTGKKGVNVLEEGLADLYSTEYTLNHAHGIWKSDDPKYTQASELVKKILVIDADIIRKLRNVQPTISLIDDELIQNINDKIPRDLCKQLTDKF